MLYPVPVDKNRRVEEPIPTLNPETVFDVNEFIPIATLSVPEVNELKTDLPRPMFDVPVDVKDPAKFPIIVLLSVSVTLNCNVVPLVATNFTLDPELSAILLANIVTAAPVIVPVSPAIVSIIPPPPPPPVEVLEIWLKIHL